MRLKSADNLRFQMDASLKAAEATIKSMEERLSARAAKEASSEAMQQLGLEHQTLVEALRQAQTSLKVKEKEITAIMKQQSIQQESNQRLLAQVRSMQQEQQERQAREVEHAQVKEEFERLQLSYLLLEEECDKLRVNPTQSRTARLS